MATKRLFIGTRIRQIDVIHTVTQFQRRCAEELPAVGFTPEPEPHMTLRFLGKVEFPDGKPPVVMERLRWAIDKMTSGRYSVAPLVFDHLGTFPGIAWLGLREDAKESALRDFQGAIDRLVVDAGFPPADFPFAPHVTIGRFVGSGTKAVADALAGWDVFAVSFRFGEVEILESVRAPDGEVSYQGVYPSFICGDVDHRALL